MGTFCGLSTYLTLPSRGKRSRSSKSINEQISQPRESSLKLKPKLFRSRSFTESLQTPPRQQEDVRRNSGNIQNHSKSPNFNIRLLPRCGSLGNLGGPLKENSNKSVNFKHAGIWSKRLSESCRNLRDLKDRNEHCKQNEACFKSIWLGKASWRSRKLQTGGEI